MQRRPVRPEWPPPAPARRRPHYTPGADPSGRQAPTFPVNLTPAGEGWHY